MIWFTCKKCQKTHSRADSSAGTMIFCDCGHGNTVPWESTTTPPVAPPVQQAPKVPDLAPIQFEPGASTGGPPATNPSKSSGYPSSSYPKDPPPLDDEERPYRRGRTEKRDPDYCFNHQRRPKADACHDCEEAFCRDCMVQFQGVQLCGPCKNFRARREELPPAPSTMASASLVISLIAGPLVMCLVLASPGSDSLRVLGYLSLLPQLLAMGLGVWALREAESERKGGGQWVAVTGIATAGLTCLLMIISMQLANRIT
jgi:hypothetical protein